MIFFHWVLVVGAVVGGLLWKSGVGAFLLGAMNDMASGYNEQYEVGDSDNDKNE